jgi:hypothetical protein
MSGFTPDCVAKVLFHRCSKILRAIGAVFVKAVASSPHVSTPTRRIAPGCCAPSVQKGFCNNIDQYLPFADNDALVPRYLLDRGIWGWVGASGYRWSC